MREIEVCLPSPDENARSPYPSNEVSSTKYNRWNFLPLALFQQLKNAVNIFFIVNGILQCIPSISTNNPLVSLIPVSWVILIGMLFEGLADYKRWKQDNRVNGQIVTRVGWNGKLEHNKVSSAQLMVGDVI